MVGTFFAHVRRQWMGALALFLVLTGGTAWAVDEWTGANIVNESLTGADVRGKGGTSSTAAVNGSLSTHDISGQAANEANGTPFVDGTLTTFDIKNESLFGQDIVESSLGRVPSALLGGLGRSARQTGPCDPNSEIPNVCVIVELDFPLEPVSF